MMMMMVVPLCITAEELRNDNIEGIVSYIYISFEEFSESYLVSTFTFLLLLIILIGLNSLLVFGLVNDKEPIGVNR